jgi:predicted dehydrogenase
MIAYLSEDSKGYDPQQSKESLNVTVREVEYDPKNMYAAELDYMSDCIKNNKAPEINTSEDGLFILKIAQAAYESAKTGCKVKL